jgi:hypothetical protein
MCRRWAVLRTLRVAGGGTTIRLASNHSWNARVRGVLGRAAAARHPSHLEGVCEQPPRIRTPGGCFTRHVDHTPAPEKEWEHQFERVSRGSCRYREDRHVSISEHQGDARPNTLIHLYVDDIDAVSKEFGVPVDEDGLAGRECDFGDPDGNRLRVATRRS